MQYTIRLSMNVPEKTIKAFSEAGWEFVSPKDSPVVSGAIVDSKMLWPGPGEPVLPTGYTLTGPDSEGYFSVDGIADGNV